MSLGDEPIIVVCTIDNKVCTHLRETVSICAKNPRPLVTGSKSATIHNVAQQAFFAFPTLGKRCGIETFVNANHLLGPLITDSVAFHIDGTGPVDFGALLGDVISSQVGGHRASAERSEG